jgi:hypothetical protein
VLDPGWERIAVYKYLRDLKFSFIKIKFNSLRNSDPLLFTFKIVQDIEMGILLYMYIQTTLPEKLHTLYES